MVERQVMMPPISNKSSLVGEAAIAKSYQPCPSVSLPFVYQPSIFVVASEKTFENVAPLSVDL